MTKIHSRAWQSSDRIKMSTLRNQPNQSTKAKKCSNLGEELRSYAIGRPSAIGGHRTHGRKGNLDPKLRMIDEREDQEKRVDQEPIHPKTWAKGVRPRTQTSTDASERSPRLFGSRANRTRNSNATKRWLRGRRRTHCSKAAALGQLERAEPGLHMLVANAQGEPVGPSAKRKAAACLRVSWMSDSLWC
jgi:hypothetical protein